MWIICSIKLLQSFWPLQQLWKNKNRIFFRLVTIFLRQPTSLWPWPLSTTGYRYHDHCSPTTWYSSRIIQVDLILGHASASAQVHPSWFEAYTRSSRLFSSIGLRTGGEIIMSKLGDLVNGPTALQATSRYLYSHGCSARINSIFVSRSSRSVENLRSCGFKFMQNSLKLSSFSTWICDDKYVSIA
jgi:hypothetical protein